MIMRRFIYKKCTRVSGYKEDNLGVLSATCSRFLEFNWNNLQKVIGLVRSEYAVIHFERYESSPKHLSKDFESCGTGGPRSGQMRSESGRMVLSSITYPRIAGG